jgi:hypothetical protein
MAKSNGPSSRPLAAPRSALSSTQRIRHLWKCNCSGTVRSKLLPTGGYSSSGFIAGTLKRTVSAIRTRTSSSGFLQRDHDVQRKLPIKVTSGVSRDPSAEFPIDFPAAPDLLNGAGLTADQFAPTRSTSGNTQILRTIVLSQSFVASSPRVDRC